MKLTQVLCKHNIQKQFAQLWWDKRHQIIQRTKTESVAKRMGVKVVDAIDYVKPKQSEERFELDHLEPLVHFDERHPDWHDRACLTYNDTNLLIEGVKQAQIITNSVKIADELPDRYQELMKDIPQNTDHLVQNILKTATMFNAHQEKLPKLKDPARPAWVFPRVYGITVVRKLNGICSEFIRLCDLLSDLELAQSRMLTKNCVADMYFEKEGSIMNFGLTADLLLMSQQPISPITTTRHKLELPVLDPLNFRISLGEKNIYKQEDKYPISTSSPVTNVHTIFAYNDPEVVKNLTELPVRETQIYARALMKAFTMAAFSARQKYGEGISDLPEPITVQCIQSNGQDFDFSVLQLNTLNLSPDSNVRNYWWSSKSMKLYEKAAYEKGIPTLEGYNPDVFRTVFAFYKNQ